MDVIIPVGYSFFQRRNYSNSTLQKLLTIKRKTILYNKDKWKIYEDKYDKNWNVIFASMKESQVICLQLDSNKFCNITVGLLNVNFSRLISLNLSHNNIQSIERLHEIDMPQIKQIYIANNYIASVRSLRKNIYHKLEYLDLSNNHIVDLTYLNQFSNKLFSKLLLQWYDSNAVGQNLNWLAKMNGLCFKYVRVESHQRLREQGKDRMLGQKYCNIQIWRKQHLNCE